jgi:hypothetical protein
MQFFLRKLIVAQLEKNLYSFMLIKNTLLCSQQWMISSYPELLK